AIATNAMATRRIPQIRVRGIENLPHRACAGTTRSCRDLSTDALRSRKLDQGPMRGGPSPRSGAQHERQAYGAEMAPLGSRVVLVRHVKVCAERLRHRHDRAEGEAVSAEPVEAGVVEELGGAVRCKGEATNLNAALHRCALADSRGERAVDEAEVLPG